jgi:hypothetical protein
MAGEAPRYTSEGGRMKRWLAETPDATLGAHMILAAAVVALSLLLLEISLFS